MLLSVALTVLGLIPAASASEVREIKVGVAVTSSIQQDTEWRQKFERRLAYASQIFEKQFNVRFRVVKYWKWKVDSGKQDSLNLLTDLMRHFPLKSADIVIGLSRLTSVKQLTDRGDLDVLGRTQPFSGYLVVRYPQNDLYKIQEETVLIHELGHLFGAIHTMDSETIMFPYVDKQIPTAFSEVNRKILRLTAAMDFKKGITALDSETIQILLSSYVIFMKYDQPYTFYYALGNFYIQLGQYDNALKALAEAVKQGDRFPKIYYDLGVVYWQLGEMERAKKALTSAAAKYDGPEQKTYKAAALKLLGGVYFREGKIDSAYRVWRNARSLDPSDNEVIMNLAAVLMEKQQYDKAIQELEKVLNADPGNPKILSNLGSAYYLSGQYDKAVLYLKKTLEASGNRPSYLSDSLAPVQIPEIHMRLGYAYTKLGQPDEAISHFETACKMQPDLTCRELLGKAYFDQKMWKQAAEQLIAVLKENKKDATLYGMIGTAYLQQDDLTRAMSFFQDGLKYAKSKSGKAAFHKQIANLYLRDRSWERAINEFRESLAYNNGDAECHYGLALAYFALEDYKSADKAIKSSLTIDPDNGRAKELAEQIKGHQRLKHLPF